jgi:hypothetical protein
MSPNVHFRFRICLALVDLRTRFFVRTLNLVRFDFRTRFRICLALVDLRTRFFVRT